MKKKLLTVCIVTVLMLFVFAACGTEKNTETEPTATVSADVTPTAEPTATPEPTPEPTPTPTPTPVPEPGTYDLFAALGIGDPVTSDADGLIAGDSWPNATGREDVCWCGILGTGFDASDPEAEPSERIVVETVLSNGEEGFAFRFANDGETDGYVGAGNYITNMQLLLEPGHTYRFTLVTKATHSKKFLNGTVSEELRQYQVYCNADKAGTENMVVVEPTGEWQTVEYVFTAADTFPSDLPVVMTVMADWQSPFMWQGFEVLIESVTLYELVEA